MDDDPTFEDDPPPRSSPIGLLAMAVGVAMAMLGPIAWDLLR